MLHTAPPVDRRRWLVLGVLCLSVFLSVVDNLIVNVALPTFVRELDATTSQLQWIVDAYTLVFAGLLIATGSLADRFGRKGFLMLGMLVFGSFSIGAALSDSPTQLIVWRGLMGIGAALIFPATLAILVNIFTIPKERAIAISIWAATSGLSVALGPVIGGWLLEHYDWGAIFYVNVPIAAVALVLIAVYVPTSRDTTIHRFDPLGTLLSIASISSLVWTIIEAPKFGWLAVETLAGFAIAASLLAAFITWERRIDHPLLDVTVFSNARFSAGSLAVTFAFFALFGFTFMVTQYFQFVRGYGTFSAGLHTVPFAIFTGVAAPVSAKIAERLGTKLVVTAGLASMSLGFLLVTTNTPTSPYWWIVVQMMFMGGGLGLVNAPATEAIMGALPPEKGGVGSAVNDTSRELGGTLGVAIVGSLFASIYSSRIDELLGKLPVPAEAVAIAKESMGAAVIVTERTGEEAGPQAMAAVKSAVDASFMSGFRAGCALASAVVALGAIIAWRSLPARCESVRSSIEIQPDLEMLTSTANVRP